MSMIRRYGWWDGGRIEFWWRLEKFTEAIWNRMARKHHDVSYSSWWLTPLQLWTYSRRHRAEDRAFAREQARRRNRSDA